MRRILLLLLLRLTGWLIGIFSTGLAEPLQWRPGPGYRVADLKVPAGGHAGFTLINPAEMGILFTNSLSVERAQRFQNLMNGSGLAAADVDGDGLVDLYFCHKQAANRLYRNLGNGRFEDVTRTAGVACTNQSSIGAVFADLDGDGAPDLVVSSFGGPHALLHNDGHGHFTDVTIASGISGKSGSTSMALADVNGDGYLDLYWCNFAVEAILRDGSIVSSQTVNGRPQVVGRYANRLKIVNGLMFELGDPDVLFLNDGTGKFVAAPWEKTFSDAQGKPAPVPRDFGLAVQIRDINGDGLPDIYVCNDFQTPDRLYFGDGRGHFRAAPAPSQPVMSYASMGVDFADIDRDGRLDFITVEMLSRDLRQHLRTAPPTQFLTVFGESDVPEQVPRNTLFWNRGDGTWSEIACYAGVAATSWSWTPLFLDVDLDGWEDLLVSNGHLRDVNNRDTTERSKKAKDRAVQATKDILSQFPALEPPKYAFRNRHDLTFENASDAWGFNSTRMAHGMITVDLDGDGDLDVVLNALEGPPLIYLNQSSAPRVAVRLKGTRPNTAGIGARLTLTGGPVTQTQEFVAGGQYLSGSEPLRVFAAGTNEMTLEVAWRSGRRSVVRGVRANQEYEIEEAGAQEFSLPPVPPPPIPLFADVSDRLQHVHTETAFNDFEQQPLLPRRYSQLGPGTAWLDLDGDGHLDLVIGSGRAGQLAAWQGDGRGGFHRIPVKGPAVPDDLLGLAAWPGPNGTHQILGAVANYETGGVDPSPAALQWKFQDGQLRPDSPLPGGTASAGPIAVGDPDRAGHLDVFVGARLTARRWPEPGGSRWFRGEGGHLTYDAVASRPFANVGPVSDAICADLDGDGTVELILACELGPIRVFQRRAETWIEITAALGLKDHTGWWNSVAVGDFDGDGRLDLVAGNRGQNSTWQVWGDGLPRISFLESADGSIGVIEAVQEGGLVLPVRDRNLLSQSFPELAEQFPTHSAYATAGVQGLLRSLGPRGGKAGELQARTLASVILLNRGDHFEIHPLPVEAQWAPVFGLAVADFDGDGRSDLVLAQNEYSLRPEDGRLNGGRALLLLGDGRGSFRTSSSVESGLAVDGEQRGAAAGDFDEDGRMDLVLGQNQGSTRLFQNRRAIPGVRVRLVGPEGNPDAVGAVVRPIRGGVRGAAQAITSGGGYGCQATTRLILSGPFPDAVEVHWPGGKVSTHPLEPGQSVVTLSPVAP